MLDDYDLLQENKKKSKPITLNYLKINKEVEKFG